MKGNRTSQVEIWGGIIKCLSERPMGFLEIAENVLEKTDAVSVGRIAVRIETMISANLVKPLIVKNKLMFRLSIQGTGDK